MIELQKIVGLLGVESTNSELEKYMKINGVDLPSELFVDKSSSNYYLERPEEGYCLIFTDSSAFEGREHDPIEQGKTFFTGVFLHSDGVDNYQQFSGILPENIAFSDSQHELISQLGKSSWEGFSNDGLTISTQCWDRPGYKLQIAYTIDLKPSVVSVFI